MSKKNVLVVFGGQSGEHEVSCSSAKQVLSEIDSNRYEIFPIGISKNGSFHYIDNTNMLGEVGINNPTVFWETQGEETNLYIQNHGDGKTFLCKPDTVFSLLHGEKGEDGVFQGFLETLNVDYVGSDTYSSSISMNKNVTKLILSQAGIPVAPWKIINKFEWDEISNKNIFIENISYPVFVKPESSGSSLGVNKVDSPEDIVSKIDEAFTFSNVVLIEDLIVGREIELAVLEPKNSNNLIVSSCAAEIVLKNTSFYDYDSKYINTEKVSLICPADISSEELSDLQRISIKVFKLLKCKNIARIDFFLTPEGPLINEINTLPGFTKFSMYPLCMKNSGISYKESLSLLIG